MADDSKTPMSHDAAMDLILAGATVTTFSYEEVIMIYLRARGILNDGARVLADPMPARWLPPLSLATGKEG